MARFTEEQLILPILTILAEDGGYMTTTEIKEKLEKMLHLSKEDKKLVRGSTRRFDRTVHNSVSHRAFHFHNNKRLVEVVQAPSRINIVKLTKYGYKYVKRQNSALLHALP